MSNHVIQSNLHLTAMKSKINSLANDIKTNDAVYHLHDGKTAAEHMSRVVNQAHDRNDKVIKTSPSGLAVIGGETSPTADDNGRDGWLFTKLPELAANTKFNYYIYGNTATSHLWTVQDLKNVSMTCSVDHWSGSGLSVPFVVVYTVPTGVDDAPAGWYHSKRAYTINVATQKILIGEPINLYCLEKPKLTNDNRYVELETVTTVGDYLGTEVILAISVHSDSSAPANTKILVSHCGYNLGNEIHRHLKLV